MKNLRAGNLLFPKCNFILSVLKKKNKINKSVIMFLNEIQTFLLKGQVGCMNPLLGILLDLS